MKLNKLIFTSILVFIFVYIFEWIFHGMILQDAYMHTADVWRSPDEMMKFMPWATANQYLFALIVTLLFSCYCKAECPKGYMMFGFKLGLLCGLLHFSIYPYLPIPICLAAFWFVGGVVETVLVGLLLGLINKK